MNELIAFLVYTRTIKLNLEIAIFYILQLSIIASERVNDKDSVFFNCQE